MTHTSTPWTLKKLAGTKGPQAIIKKLPGGVDAIICLFIHSVLPEDCPPVFVEH